MFPDVSAYISPDGPIRSDSEFCEYILDEAGVAIVPGSAYQWPGSVRISFSYPLETLEIAMDNIEKAVLKYER